MHPRIFVPLCDFITEKPFEKVYNKGTKGKHILYTKKGMYIMSALKLNKNSFESLRVSEKPLLLDFFADWCGPCRMVSPIIDEIASEREDIVVGKINVDDEPELASEFGVYSIPTLIVMKNGKVVKSSSGARPKEQILEMLEG